MINLVLLLLNKFTDLKIIILYFLLIKFYVIYSKLCNNLHVQYLNRLKRFPFTNMALTIIIKWLKFYITFKLAKILDLYFWNLNTTYRLPNLICPCWRSLRFLCKKSFYLGRLLLFLRNLWYSILLRISRSL